MKKFIKVLLFSMLLFISTKVSAADYMKFYGHNFRQYTELNGSFSIKTTNDIYAFCLDRNYQFSDTGITYEDFNEGHFTAEIKEYKVRNVLVKAYSDGLGTNSNVYGLDDEEFYAVTQMAVWYVAHHNDKNGYDAKFDAFLDAKDARRKAFHDMILTENIPEYTYSKNITFANDLYSLTLNDNNEYETEEIKFNAPSLSTYKVTASKGACVVYGNDCKSEVQIKSGESFKLRVANDESKEVTVSATVKSTSKVFTGYDFAMYMPVDYYGHAYVNSDGTPNLSEDLYNVYGEKWVNDDGDRVNNGVQRMGYLVPKYGDVTSTVTVKSTIEKDTKDQTPEVKTVEISVCKKDCAIDSEITISELVNDKELGIVYAKLDAWNSKTNESHKVTLKVDTFYKLDDTTIKDAPTAVATFIKVTEAGEVKLCSIKNSDLSTADCEAKNDNFEVKGSEIIINNCPESKIDGPGVVETKTTDDTTSTSIEAPNTGIATSAYLIGSLVMLAGAGTVVIAKKKENM